MEELEEKKRERDVEKIGRKRGGAREMEKQNN